MAHAAVEEKKVLGISGHGGGEREGYGEEEVGGDGRRRTVGDKRGTAESSGAVL